MRWKPAAAALLLISLASSTPEGRERARARIRRWNPLLWAIALALWAIILWPVLVG